MNIHMNLGENSYDIIVERGILQKASQMLKLNRKVFIITDNGVPEKYAETVQKQCKEGYVATVESGEESKSIAVFESLLKKMLELGFGRGDCVIAVGGGVVGDLAGFVASAYMRGVDFYNIPTTVLSQIDSSIGGKVAVNMSGIKNVVGAFYQPKTVLIDPEVLSTLPDRQVSNGLSEALKMSLTFSEELFELFEHENPRDNIDNIIIESLKLKKHVVEQDEKESGLRKVLNFGHTIGHAIESNTNLSNLFHGECVALGMIPMCGESVRQRLIPVLKKLNLPTSVSCDIDAVFDAMSHDKKIKNNKVTAIFVKKIGKFEMKDMSCDNLKSGIELICERRN